MKSLFLFFIAFLFLQSSVLAQEGWVLQNSGVTNKLLGVFFTDADNGTAVGFDGTILHTTNGGVTWDSLSINNVEIMWDVHFINTDIGMAVGAVDSGYIIMKTTNGGVSWDSLYSGTTGGNGLYGIFLIDDNTATAIGQGGTILRTTNGGSSWVDQSNQPWELYTDVYFTDVDNGIVVGTGGTVLHTSNGGTDWVSQPSGTDNDLWGVWFTDANTGIAVGRGAKIIKTTDGGTTWDSLMISTTSDLWDVCFTNANTGTVVTGWGYGGDHSGEIYRTTDGGLTWLTQLSNYPYGLHSVSFTDANNGTVVGVNGTIFHTTTGGVSFVEENEIDEIPTEFRLSNNFPNPFNPSTKIKYSVPQTSSVVIKIFDVLCNEIKTLVNEEKQTSTYEITWYAEGLPSGVYFYRLKAGSFVETKKMVLMK